ncbi:MAG TPA: hypothetical protein VGG28_13975 [Kofleriaceae bacterium]
MKTLVALALAGCVIRNDITHVVLRDPMTVAVAGILPVGSDRGEIPPTSPPYLDTPDTGSWIERDGSDASDPLEAPTPPSIVVWCPKCPGTRRLVLIDKPALELSGRASDLLRFDGDDLHIRWMFDVHHGRRRHGYTTHHIALDLVTPRSNVVSIDYESHVQRSDDDAPFEIGGMVWMGLWAAGGATLVGVGVHEHQADLEVAGSIVIAIGLAALSLLVHEYRARDEHHPITVR